MFWRPAPQIVPNNVCEEKLGTSHTWAARTAHVWGLCVWELRSRTARV